MLRLGEGGRGGDSCEAINSWPLRVVHRARIAALTERSKEEVSCAALRNHSNVNAPTIWHAPYPATDLESGHRVQFEIASQFFIGYFDGNGAYVDDIISVMTRYGLSINSFGFDAFTSIPWSFLDYWAYQASTHAQTHTRTDTTHTSAYSNTNMHTM